MHALIGFFPHLLQKQMVPSKVACFWGETCALMYWHFVDWNETVVHICI